MFWTDKKNNIKKAVEKLIRALTAAPQKYANAGLKNQS